MAVCRRARSASPVTAGASITKSMNSGTAASVALPERSSFGMMRSTSTRTVAHSCGVKNFGLNGDLAAVVAFRACVAAWWACSASAGVHVNPTAAGTAPSALSAFRLEIAMA